MLRLLQVHRSFVVVAAVLVLAACSEAAAPLPICPDSVSVAVTPGLTPQFSWTPACLLAEVQVADSATLNLLWDVGQYRLPDDNRIAPPVTYGVAPAAARVQVAPATLASGHAYLVGIFRYDPLGGFGKLIAATYFRP